MRILLALLALGLVGCPGSSVSLSCSRTDDGTVECTIEAHRHAEGKTK